MFTVLVRVDECAVNNGGCDHSCVDTYDGYCCVCDQGYQLMALDVLVTSKDTPVSTVNSSVSLAEHTVSLGDDTVSLGTNDTCMDTDVVCYLDNLGLRCYCLNQIDAQVNASQCVSKFKNSMNTPPPSPIAPYTPNTSNNPNTAQHPIILPTFM